MTVPPTRVRHSLQHCLSSMLWPCLLHEWGIHFSTVSAQCYDRASYTSEAFTSALAQLNVMTVPLTRVRHSLQHLLSSMVRSCFVHERLGTGHSSEFPSESLWVRSLLCSSSVLAYWTAHSKQTLHNWCTYIDTALIYFITGGKARHELFMWAQDELKKVLFKIEEKIELFVMF